MTAKTRKEELIENLTKSLAFDIIVSAIQQRQEKGYKLI